MDRERWRRLSPLLDEALELSAEEQERFLAELAQDDPGLAAELEALLAAERRAGTFLEGGLPGPASKAGERLGPYEVLRQVGAGGMGEVYEARDTRLGRRVAVKLLPPAWNASPEARERFLREARAASALDHPNLCTVYDVGTRDDGRPYLVMAYYEGETLERRIARGPLRVEEAVDLATQVARGLERAHEAGIVHRDVKPSNVMVTRHGEVKVLDFGIAKMAGETGLTRTGPSPGTPAYMSPEQARGGPADARTDVWSLGAMLYEMLAGRKPFTGGDPQAAIYAILNLEPEPLRGVSPALARTVSKALAKDPAARHRGVAELRAELEGTAHRPPWVRRLLAAAVLGGGLLGFGTWWLTRLDGGPPEVPAVPDVVVPVVAVLPFVNRTGDADLDGYGEGAARLVADALSSSRHLRVVSAARASTEGIDVLLTGEVLPGPSGLTLATRLTHTADGRQLAARRFDGLDPADLLRAADEVAREARKALGVPPEEAVDLFAADFAAENPEAYGAYLEGLEAFTTYRYAEAEDAFRAALERAPGFTMARYRLAHTLAVTGRTEEATAEISRAVAESGRLADRDARYVRAAEDFIARRYDDAIAAWRELLERYPYETEARYYLADALESTGRFEEELEVVEVLARLEPQSPATWSLSGTAHLELGNLSRAVSDFERYVELAPESANAHHLLADAYRAQGELDLAAAEYEAALRADPSFHFSSVALAVVDALAGRRDEARERLESLAGDPEAAPRHRLDAAFELASLDRAEGRFEQAAERLAAVEDLLARERVREAMALAVRGLSRLERGERDAARKLIDRAVERSPGVATRYLFARALLELEEERHEAFAAAVAEIVRGALPPDDPDRTEDKAAAYLRGLAHLQAGDAEAAIAELRRAVALEGYEYAVYRLALARAYLLGGRLREAMAAARQASEEVDLRRPRLDLELDRTRALLVLAQVEEAMDRPEEAAKRARQFLERFASADPGLPDVILARRLAAAG